jgi:hypothetical protein
VSEKRWREKVARKGAREEVSEKKDGEKRCPRKGGEKRWREIKGGKHKKRWSEKRFKRLQLHPFEISIAIYFHCTLSKLAQAPNANRARSRHLGSAETTPPAPLSGSQLCGRPPCSLCSRPFRLNRTSNDDGAEACCAAKP